jgi:hypothetical protein
VLLPHAPEYGGAGRRGQAGGILTGRFAVAGMSLRRFSKCLVGRRGRFLAHDEWE